MDATAQLGQLLQQLWNGVTVGAVYALIALGYTMVYGILELINFAHGEIYMIGAYLGVILLALTLPLGLPLAPAIALALLGSMLLTAAWGFTLERGAYRPLRTAPRLSPLISALGASIGLQQLVLLLQGSRAAVPARELPPLTWSLGRVTVSGVDAFIVSTALLLMLLLHLFIRRTRMGKAMRATAQDKTMASLLGISIDRVISVTFVIGSALAAVAGVMIALKYGKVDYLAGYTAGLKAFTAAVLGGIGNVPGAMLGGLLLGVLESLGAGFISSETKDLFAFAVLILVLIVKPSGLLGERVADKVAAVMGRRIALVLLAAVWVGLLVLPLNIRVEKRDVDDARFEPHLVRSIHVGGLVALAGLTFLFLGRLQGSPAGAAMQRAAGAWGERMRQAVRLSGPLRLALFVLPLLAAAAVPAAGNLYHVTIAIQTAIYVALALGLNLVVGQAGLLVLGYAAFYAAGAYTFGILHRELGLSFWACLPIGGAVAALLGLALGAPTLRLRGDYLAIVTLGFGEMMRVVLITADRLTGGPNGISRIPRPELLGVKASDSMLYWLTLGLVAVTALVSRRLNDSRIGRAWMAMREDETAARAMGINITGLRLLAFSLSATWAGLCGVFFAAKQSFISPESFTFLESVTVLAMVVLGGMGSIPGVVAGAVILGLLPEVLRGVSEYRMITLAALMVLMMIFRPQGLFPSVRRKLELTEERQG